MGWSLIYSRFQKCATQENRATWQEAFLACAYANMTLLTVESEEENKKAQKLLQAAQVPGEDPWMIWMGATRIVGVHIHEDFIWLSLNRTVTYSNWVHGVPDRYYPHEWCMNGALKGGDFVWDDIDCQQKMHFMCRAWKPEDNDTHNVVDDEELIPINYGYYCPSNPNKTYETGKTICHHNELVIATLETYSEYLDIQSSLMFSADPFWQLFVGPSKAQYIDVEFNNFTLSKDLWPEGSPTDLKQPTKQCFAVYLLTLLLPKLSLKVVPCDNFIGFLCSEIKVIMNEVEEEHEDDYLPTGKRKMTGDQNPDSADNWAFNNSTNSSSWENSDSWASENKTSWENSDSWASQNTSSWEHSDSWDNSSSWNNSNAWENANSWNNSNAWETSNSWNNSNAWENANSWNNSNAWENSNSWNNSNAWENSSSWNNSDSWENSNSWNNSNAWENSSSWNNSDSWSNSSSWNNSDIFGNWPEIEQTTPSFPPPQSPFLPIITTTVEPQTTQSPLPLQSPPTPIIPITEPPTEHSTPRQMKHRDVTDYFIIKGKNATHWYAARKACLKENAELAYIRDDIEMAVVKQVMNDNRGNSLKEFTSPATGLYTGAVGSQPFDKNGFQWNIEGQQHLMTDYPITSELWGFGQPDNANPLEQCTVFYFNGPGMNQPLKMADLQCREKRGFICAKITHIITGRRMKGSRQGKFIKKPPKV